jgi:hypothetical protein
MFCFYKNFTEISKNLIEFDRGRQTLPLFIQKKNIFHEIKKKSLTQK